MKNLLILLLSLVGFFPSTALAIPATDAPGSADYPGLPRYAGSKILIQNRQEFGRMKLQLDRIPSPNVTGPQVRTVEGSLHRTTYVFDNSGETRRTALEVFRNYEQALKDAGFSVLWQGSGKELGGGPPADAYLSQDLFSNLLRLARNDCAYLAAEKGGLHASLYVADLRADRSIREGHALNSFNQKIDLPSGTILIQLDIANNQPMEEKMVVVKAEEMQNSISATGRIALYGIHFDFNKADLKPESGPTLVEIANLLKASPDLKLLVVGHTDNVGTYDFNRDLSQRRAAAVVAELTSKHGIASGRLTPQGVAFASPITTNATEEGRALNRRVELVEY